MYHEGINVKEIKTNHYIIMTLVINLKRSIIIFRGLIMGRMKEKDTQNLFTCEIFITLLIKVINESNIKSSENKIIYGKEYDCSLFYSLFS